MRVLKLSFAFVTVLGFSFLINADTLSDVYAHGKVKFVEEIVIKEDNLPDGVIFGILWDIAVDSEGCVYVSDPKAFNIKKFSGEGKFLKEIGRKGEGPGEFSHLSFIEIVKDKLIALSDRKFSFFTLKGEFIKFIPWEIKKGLPEEIEALSDGKIVMEIKEPFMGPKSRNIHYINLYDSELNYIKTVYQKDLGEVKFVKRGNAFLSVIQKYPLEIKWSISPEGKIILGFNDKYEISVIDPMKGEIFSFHRKHKPVKVSKSEREKFLKNKNLGIEVSEYKPVFDDIKVDSEGNIWVHLYRENSEEENTTFDVFSKDGKFINTVRIVNGYYPYGAKMIKDGFWKIDHKKESVRIVKYRIKRA